MKNRSFLYLFLILSVILNSYCNAGIQNQGLSVGETVPNPEISPISRYEYDRLPGPYRLYDYKEDQVLLIAFMPTVSDANNYANVMTSAFDTYFSKGLSFRSFEQYQYSNPQIKVIVVTPDKEEVLKNYLVEKNYEFEFVSDENLDIAKSFGIATWDADKYTSGSFVYVVDKNNKITLADHDYKGQGEKLKSVQTELYASFDLKEQIKSSINVEPLMTGDAARDFNYKFVTFNGKESNVSPIDVANGKLSDYIGKKNVLIAFYPAAYSYSCSAEVTKFDHWAEDRMLEKVKNSQLNNDDLEILMVSVSNPYILTQWRNELNLNNVKLISDDNGSISQLYNSYNAFGYNKRTVFLVDKEGKLTYINWDYKVDENDFALLKDNVTALK